MSRTQDATVSNGKKCMERQIGYFETSEQQTVPDQAELRRMSWYYDEISGQNAVELLIEFGQPGNFIVRNSEKFGQFNIIWLVQKQEIKSAEILIKDGVCFLESDPRIFDSLQSLIEFNMENNLLSAPLENKEMHRLKSQQRQIKQS